MAKDIYIYIISALGRWRLEVQEFKDILSYTASSKPAWATVEHVKTNKQTNLEESNLLECSLSKQATSCILT